MPSPRVVDAVVSLGGVARTSALRARGIGKVELREALATGLLLSPRMGVYCLASAEAPVIEAVSHGGVIACATAARAYGLWTLDATATATADAVPRRHAWIAGKQHPTRLALDEEGHTACCIIHRDTPVDAPRADRVGLVHCLVQVFRCLGEEAFFAALESGLRQGLVDRDARALLRRALPKAVRWLVDFARADADSGLESLLRLRLHRHGLSLASQVRIPGVGVVDFVIGDCLILEADGATHGGDHRHIDLVRDAVAVSLGFSTLRFDYALIVHEWQLVESAVLVAVGRNLHRSVAGLTW